MVDGRLWPLQTRTSSQICRNTKPKEGKSKGMKRAKQYGRMLKGLSMPESGLSEFKSHAMNHSAIKVSLSDLVDSTDFKSPLVILTKHPSNTHLSMEGLESILLNQSNKRPQSVPFHKVGRKITNSQLMETKPSSNNQFNQDYN
jgi:hypothetical protein